MKCIEKMKTPPMVGQKYLVPCVYGEIANIGPHQLPDDWWPVFRPSHQDSKYAVRYKTVWKETADGFIGVDEVYYKDDPTTPHHYHVDPRFTTESMYTIWEVHNKSWYTTIMPKSAIEYRELECIREIPPQRLFTGFGRQFVEDYKDSKIICGRCPHKGTDLKTMPTIDGVVTCPAHGLKFDCKTKKCLTSWED